MRSIESLQKCLANAKRNTTLVSKSDPQIFETKTPFVSLIWIFMSPNPHSKGIIKIKQFQNKYGDFHSKVAASDSQLDFYKFISLHLYNMSLNVHSLNINRRGEPHIFMSVSIVSCTLVSYDVVLSDIA